VKWNKFTNAGLPVYYMMGYSNPEANPNNDQEVLDSCLQLGCAAVAIEANRWLTYYRNVPDRFGAGAAEWTVKPGSTIFVVSDYVSGARPQPSMKYGCSRHHHACVPNPPLGSAPCCSHVMTEVMHDLTRSLTAQGQHWRLAQGQQLSMLRDGVVQLWDHDFDPIWEDSVVAKSAMATEMHLAGRATKFREADYYYTKKVATRLRTDWSKYKVWGGDFDWGLEEYHDAYTLQRNPTFMDADQAHGQISADSTFPCGIPGSKEAFLLCTRNWKPEAQHLDTETPSGFAEIPSYINPAQVEYTAGTRDFAHSDVSRRMGHVLYDEAGRLRTDQAAASKIEAMLQAQPNYWVATQAP
jgi:hypothetical protein